MNTRHEIDRPRYSGPIACVLASALAVASALFGSEPKAPTPVTIARMASAKCGSRIPTHVTLTGFVADVTKEADGDYHLKVCASLKGRPCTIVEIIPLLGADRIVAPLKRVARSKAVVRKGDLVAVTGISRWDSTHRWMEVHPATGVVVLDHLKPTKVINGRRGNV
jgi:hypothetical protein